MDEIARHLNTLARVGNERQRQSVAADLRTPLETLCYLALSPLPLIRQAVAGNVNADLQLLTKLCCDDLPQVRQAVAANPSTPIHLLQAAYEYAKPRDRKPMVPMALAANPNTPLPLLLALMLDHQGSKVGWVEKARQRIQEQELQRWLQMASTGEVALSLEICSLPQRKMTVGDALLTLGLSAVYQAIQSVELVSAIRSVVHPAHDAEQPRKRGIRL